MSEWTKSCGCQSVVNPQKHQKNAYVYNFCKFHEQQRKLLAQQDADIDKKIRHLMTIRKEIDDLKARIYLPDGVEPGSPEP